MAELSGLLEEMISLLPVGFTVTVGVTRVDGVSVANAAVHSQEPGGQVVMHEVGDTPIEAARKLLARLDGPTKGAHQNGG